MAPIHDAAWENDVDFIEASVAVDAIVFLLARSLGRRLARHAAAFASRSCCGTLQDFHKKGGDINARDVYATPQPNLPILAPAESAPSTARERCLILA